MVVSQHYSKKLLRGVIAPTLLDLFLFVAVFCPIFLCAVIALPFYLMACKAVIDSYTFCLRQHRLITIANYRLKGVRGVFVDSALIFAFQALSICFLAIDTVIFPEVASVAIESPVFITGIPRSGTTFTHRVLTTPPPAHRVSANLLEDSPFAVHALWEILCPSLTLRYALFHAVRFIDAVAGRLGASSILQGAYDLKLNSEAAEEGLLGMHINAGDFWCEFLPIGFFFALSRQYLGIGEEDHWRRHHVVLLRALLQRQIYWSGKTQVVAKSPSLTWFLDDVMAEFKDCRILLLVRDPYDVVVSNLSLFHSAWATLYGAKWMEQCLHLNSSEDVWRTAFKAVVWRRSEQSKRCLAVLENGNANRNILVLRYDDIKRNLPRCFEKMVEHCRLSVSPETTQWIRDSAERQKTRKRSHKINTIASYGLNPREMEQLFAAVIERWGFNTEWK